MDTVDQERIRAIKQQAVKLTEATFLKMEPKPLRPASKVAPLVYALLIQDIDPKVIEQALINARAHTEAGIQYAISQLMPATTAGQRMARPQYWTEREKHVPTDEERSTVASIIEETRRRLRGGK